MLINLRSIQDPLCEDAQRKIYPKVRRLASMAESVVVLDRYLWHDAGHHVHFGALCPAGTELLLSEKDGRHASHPGSVTRRNRPATARTRVARRGRCAGPVNGKPTSCWTGCMTARSSGSTRWAT